MNLLRQFWEMLCDDGAGDCQMAEDRARQHARQWER